MKNARRKGRIKRGRGFQRVEFEGLGIAHDQPDERILLIDEALKRQENEDPDSARASRIVLSRCGRLRRP